MKARKQLKELDVSLSDIQLIAIKFKTSVYLTIDVTKMLLTHHRQIKN